MRRYYSAVLERYSRRVTARTALLIVVLLLVSVLALTLRMRASPADESLSGSAESAARTVVRIPRFVDPAAVKHRPRFLYSFDPPRASAALRAEERLDEIVRGASGDLETFARLTAWTRSQFEPGAPNPYPPFDARIILHDIRRGATRGFCAQYCCVLVQALQSFGHYARYVSVRRHEVVEAFSREERRWICLDPLHAAVYRDETGRALNALDLHRRWRAGVPILPAEGARPGAVEELGDAFASVAYWLRNDQITRPINFQDLDRYRLRFLDADEPDPADGSLVTRYMGDIYFDPEGL